jgi:hypothetical protein
MNKDFKCKMKILKIKNKPTTNKDKIIIPPKKFNNNNSNYKINKNKIRITGINYSKPVIK